MSKAAIYARKSKVTETGDSIENQIKICKQYLENFNISDFTVYRDEGFSGKNTDRPEFLKMLEDARGKKFSILICYKLDRISRNVADFSNLVNELEKLGISFVSVNEQFDTSTAMGRAMMLICSVFAQLERETISLRVRDNMYALAEDGKWLGGEPPTGFNSERLSFIDSSGKEKTYCILKPVESEIELVKLIFSKYLELKSLNKLLKYMLSNNIRTKRGNDWTITTLNAILTNPAYVCADNAILEYFKSKDISVRGDIDGEHGILIYNKRIGKKGKNKEHKKWIYAVSSHEGIINSEDWLKVQHLININKSKAPSLGSSHTALLSGIIRCAKCNSFMRVAYGKQYADKKDKKFYYVCSKKKTSGRIRCDNKNVNGWELDNIVMDKLKELSVDKSTLIEELQKHKADIENSDENIELRNLLQNLKQNKLMLQNLINNVSLTDDKETAKFLLSRISQIKDESKFIEKRLGEIKIATDAQAGIINNCDTFIKLIKDFKLVADISTLEERRKLVSTIIEKVYVDGDTGKVILKFWGVDEI